jgi:UDP-N-acetylmuramoylalanine--D-glutamate ligase
LNIIQTKYFSDYHWKKVLVVAMARNGIAAAKLLFELGALVTVNDKKPFDKHPEAPHLLEKGMKVVLGSHPIELMDESLELMVKTPEIPYNNPIIEKAIELK